MTSSKRIGSAECGQEESIIGNAKPAFPHSEKRWNQIGSTSAMDGYDRIRHGALLAVGITTLLRADCRTCRTGGNLFAD